MAKQSNLNAKLISLKEEMEQLKANEKQLEKLYALGDKITEAQFAKIEALESTNKQLDKSKKAYETLIKKQKEKKKLLDAELKDYEDMETSLASIGNTIGKNSKAYQFQSEKLAKTKGTLESIGTVISKNAKIGDIDKKNVVKLLKAYKQNNSSILEAYKLKERDKISQQEYLEVIKKSQEAYSDIRSEIELSADATLLLGEHISNMDAEINTFGKSAKLASSTLKGIETSIDGIASSGVEGIRELGDVLKSATNGGKGLALAMGTLAGVAAGMAYNFGLIGNKLGTIAGYDKDIAGLTGEIDIINKKVSMGMEGFGARNFVMEEAMLQFSTTAQQMGASFQAASKTALFGNKLGSVGYGGVQLQMAGISAENIAESMKAASDATGRMPSGKIAADMSIMAQRTGQSTESIAIINETFQRLDNVSEKTALNLQEGVRAMADKAGVNLGSAMAEIAEASKDTLSYQIKGSSQLAKQVIAAKSLGVSFNEVAKAGQNMVLNYKDSIKSEMSLSAMLGKNVNLSEVRAKFMSGDTEGAMNALKAQGLNPKDMNMFQQQALQQALGGMDLNSIQKISENTAKSGGNLKEGSAGSGNKEYLQRVQERESSLAGANAMISAAAELKSIKLRSADEMQKQEAIIKNVGNIATLMNERDLQGMLKNAETMITTALISTVATVVTTFLMSKGAGLFSKLRNVFKTGAPAMEAVESPILSTTKKAGKKVAEKVGTKGIAKVGVKALGKSLLKKIPVIGLLAGVGFGLQRMMKGDMAGAALELASGAVANIPGIGTAAALGIDMELARRDMGASGSTSKPSAGGAKPTISKEQQAKSIQTGTKPTVDAVNTMGQKQVDAQKMVAEKAKVTLTETQYQNKLQQEMVTLIGITAQYLAQISENTKGDTPININGKVLNNTLLNQARRNYAVAR
jgi:hypothetical protein